MNKVGTEAVMAIGAYVFHPMYAAMFILGLAAGALLTHMISTWLNK